MHSPTLRVLSSLQEHGVRHLLMGGQACILYGAAEFSRDTDVAIVADSENLEHLRLALADLRARVVAVPPFEARYLADGHAVHFECGADDASGMRLDVMSVMRNVPNFGTCWARRTTVDLPDGDSIEVMGLEDLVNCKKTRRDKDWPMVRRLVDVHYLTADTDHTPDRFRFWLRELRSPELLLECAARAHAASAAVIQVLADVASTREAAAIANMSGSHEEIVAALAREEARERAEDDAYWRPRIRELEQLRHQSRDQ